jgi:Flp pilus assembly protein TadD
VDLARGKWIINLTEWEAEFDRGMTELEAGRLDQAERTLRQLFDDSPAGTPMRTQAAFGLGTVYAKLEDYDQAYPLLKEAVALDPRRFEYWANLALVCGHRLRVFETERAWRKCLELGPSEDVVRMANSSLELIEQETRARLAANPQVTRQALARQERRFDDGLRALDRRDAAGAADLFRRSVAIDPMHHQSWGNLGSALVNLGQFDEGEQALEQALKLRPDYQFARFNLEIARRVRVSATVGARRGLWARMASALTGR